MLKLNLITITNEIQKNQKEKKSEKQKMQEYYTTNYIIHKIK